MTAKLKNKNLFKTTKRKTKSKTSKNQKHRNEKENIEQTKTKNTLKPPEDLKIPHIRSHNLNLINYPLLSHNNSKITKIFKF